MFLSLRKSAEPQLLFEKMYQDDKSGSEQNQDFKFDLDTDSEV